VGHQWWYGMVANNEVEHAWLDEGLDRFSDARTRDLVYGPEKLVRRYLSRRPGRLDGVLPVRFDDLTSDRLVRLVNGYRAMASSEIPARPTFLHYPGALNGVTYYKPAVWLTTLERYLGWGTLQKILSVYFQRWKYRHPGPEDFFAVANEVSGQDLGWFFDQVHRGSESFDYAVESVASLMFAAHDRWLYRSEAVVRRLGGGTFPVEVLMVLQDGSEIRQTWDGKERWKMFVAERSAPLRYAVVDPERKLVLDLNYTNNSRLLEPAPALPAVKWTAKWMIWLQDFLTTFTFFA
jgi:hypothetical protein